MIAQRAGGRNDLHAIAGAILYLCIALHEPCRCQPIEKAKRQRVQLLLERPLQ
jgi:hypothetical protein